VFSYDYRMCSLTTIECVLLRQDELDLSTYPKVIVANVVFACDVTSFYRHFWSQHSGFITRFLAERKCVDVKCSSWNRLNSAANSFAREVQVCVF